jgi:hypothetical protein
MSSTRIDRQKLRTAVEGLSREGAASLLDEALDLVPPAKIAKLVGRHIELSKVRPDPRGRAALLAEVAAFEKASLSGKHYEGFNVNSRNFMQKSEGTRRWIAECRRLLGRCAAAVTKAGDAAALAGAFESLFGMLRRIDQGEDFVFFANEQGSWQVGVDWRKILPAWFACLSKTTGPEEYARRVIEVVEDFCKHDGAKLWAAARRAGTPAQGRALRAARVR